MDGTQTDRERGKVPGEEGKESMSSVQVGMIRKVRRQELMSASGRDV